MTIVELISTPQAKRSAANPWQPRQHTNAAAPVTAILLIPAAMSVLLPWHPDSFRTDQAENRRYVADRRRLTKAQRRLANLKKQHAK